MRSEEEVRKMLDGFVELRSKERSSEWEVALLDKKIRVLAWVLGEINDDTSILYEGLVN